MSAIEKHTHADLHRRYPLYIEVGLLLTLALLVTAVNVEWRSEDDFDIEQNEQETVEMKQIEQTQQIEKPPPENEPGDESQEPEIFMAVEQMSKPIDEVQAGQAARQAGEGPHVPGDPVPTGLKLDQARAR